jgi:hypothetical protein
VTLFINTINDWSLVNAPPAALRPARNLGCLRVDSTRNGDVAKRYHKRFGATLGATK